ncbi:hypothetical protein [Foetidibacter luteolus]|uniref:hypothetical protein n=1 Tax=Foetidibacter luteolus TaxID=2608880 RepID=UPI00129B632E|nr:hypothetical protein [Foetidibacter luteolus]
MKKKLLIATVVLAAIGTALYFYLKSKRLTDFEPMIKEKIQSVVKEGSKGLYNISIGKIDIDVIGSKVNLLDIKLDYDSSMYSQMRATGQQPNDLFKVAVSAIVIDGITPVDIVQKKNIRLNVLYIDNPVITIHHRPGKNQVEDTSTLYQRITEQIGSFGISSLGIRNAGIHFINDSTKAEDHFPELNISLTDFLIDASTQNDTSRFFYAKDANISAVKYSKLTADSLYKFSLDSVMINAAEKQVSIKKFSLEPRVSKTQFRKIMKTRKDRYDISFNDIRISGINWWGIITNESVRIDEIMMANGSAEIYSDKTLPAGGPPGNGNYPHQKLFKSAMPIAINTINIKNLDVTYSEFNEETFREGHIYFQNTDAVITNITNIPDRIARNAMLNIDASTSFMKSAAMKAGFRFDLSQQAQGVFSVYARLGRLDGKLLNIVTEPLAMVKINEAVVNSLKLDMTGNNNSARGNLLLTYSDLDITILKKDDDGKLKKRGLLSFIANTLKLNKHYPKKDKPAVPFNIYYKRPQDKTFFSLVWKTILDGVKQTAGM